MTSRSRSRSRKSPKTKGVPPTEGKLPRIKQEPNVSELTPAWQLANMDMDSQWGFSHLDKDTILHIKNMLKQHESMKWGEIEQDRRRNHSVLVANIIRPAQRRFIDLGLDSGDILFRFRFSGKQRLWGIRVGRVLQILWWDPEHEIFPSTLPNT